MKVWLQGVSFLVCFFVLGGFAGCARRTTPTGSSPSAASAAPAKGAPSASAAAPVDPCPRLGGHDTPWSGGGLVRSLQPEAILEPAVRAAAASGGDQNWEVSEAALTGRTADGNIGVVPVRAFATGAAVVALRHIGAGYCVSGVWFYGFGGAGVTFNHVAEETSNRGRAALVTYAVTEGWREGGATAWVCRFVTVRVDTRGILKIHETPEAKCRAKPLPVRLERKKDQLRLREGPTTWLIDD